MQDPLIDDVDDIAFDAVRQLRGKVARQKHRGFGVDREMGIPEGFLDVTGAIRFEGRGVVDQEGQRAEQAGGGLDQAGARAAIGQIGLEDLGPSAGLADAVAHRAGTGLIGAEMDDHGMAGFGQSMGNGRADAITGAGHKGDRLILIRGGKR